MRLRRIEAQMSATIVQLDRLDHDDRLETYKISEISIAADLLREAVSRVGTELDEDGSVAMRGF